MNDKQRCFIDKLQHQLSAFGAVDFYSDFECLKWLQENQFDIETTASLLRQYWRLTNSYDFSKQPKYHEIMENYWPYGFIDAVGKNKDKDYLVYIETLGTLDGDGVLQSVPQGHINLNRFYSSEIIVKSMRQHERSTGRRIDQIYVIDMADCEITAKNLALLSGAYLVLIKTLIKYYAAYQIKFIIINVPNFSSILYNAFKHVLPEKTKKKIIVLGTNWRKDILQHVDPNCLPVHYGGNMVDENNDPKCPNKVVYTKKVPFNLYWTPSADYPKSSELTVLTVQSSSCQFVTVEIDEIGSSLKWFYNTDATWGFGVFYSKDPTQTDIDQMDMVYPQIDYHSGSTRVMEHDWIECKKKGFYKIWFNNSFSWFSKLHIYYKIDVIKPH